MKTLCINAIVMGEHTEKSGGKYSGRGRSERRTHRENWREIFRKGEERKENKEGPTHSLA